MLALEVAQQDLGLAPEQFVRASRDPIDLPFPPVVQERRPAVHRAPRAEHPAVRLTPTVLVARLVALLVALLVTLRGVQPARLATHRADPEALPAMPAGAAALLEQVLGVVAGVLALVLPGRAEARACEGGHRGARGVAAAAAPWRSSSRPNPPATPRLTRQYPKVR
ncbi:MAG: hypothetical protein ACRDWV_10205 [Acidimicrobiales bacterium]